MVSSKISPSRSPLPYWERQAPLAPVQVSPRREHFEQETAQVNGMPCRALIEMQDWLRKINARLWIRSVGKVTVVGAVISYVCMYWVVWNDIINDCHYYLQVPASTFGRWFINIRWAQILKKRPWATQGSNLSHFEYHWDGLNIEYKFENFITLIENYWHIEASASAVRLFVC